MVNYALPKAQVDFGLESLVEKRKEPVFAAIKDIHESLLKQDKDLSKKYEVCLAEYSCSRILYSIYVQKGLLIKDMEYADELLLTNDQYFALKQFYYDCHATYPVGCFNILKLTVEWKDGKFDVTTGFYYLKSIDAEANSSVGLTPDPKKLHDTGLNPKASDFKQVKLA